MAEYVATGVIGVVVLSVVLAPAGGVLQRAMALPPSDLRGETGGPGAGPHRITVVRYRPNSVRAPYFGPPGRDRPAPERSRRAIGMFVETSAPDLASGGLLTGPA